MILEKTDGNPFFVEEVVRTLIDTGAVVRDESGARWRSVTEVEEIAIPENVQTLITSRFDRLESEVRSTLQMASVIGRSFYYKVLKLVSDTTSQLEGQLTTLQRVELIREAARVPELEYMFRHELTRDAAYNSILRRRLRQFHRRVGEAIEELFIDRVEEQASRLAHHFDEGRDFEKALKYYTLAADAAARLYANVEANTQYARAITRGPSSSPGRPPRRPKTSFTSIPKTARPCSSSASTTRPSRTTRSSRPSPASVAAGPWRSRRCYPWRRYSRRTPPGSTPTKEKRYPSRLSPWRESWMTSRPRPRPCGTYCW